MRWGAPEIAQGCLTSLGSSSKGLFVSWDLENSKMFGLYFESIRQDKDDLFISRPGEPQVAVKTLHNTTKSA